MVSVTRLWMVLLAAPGAWIAMLGLQYSLTNDVCMGRSRVPMAIVAVASILLAAAAVLLAWRWRRSVPPDDPARERARLMLGIAVGGGAVFVLLNLLSAVPILVLDPCRT